jgi:hypothetical protein
MQLQTNLQSAEARLALLEAQLTSALPEPAADAIVETDTHQSAADKQHGVSAGASTDAAAVDDGVVSVSRHSRDRAAGAEEQWRAGAGGSTADGTEDGAEMNGLRL